MSRSRDNRRRKARARRRLVKWVRWRIRSKSWTVIDDPIRRVNDPIKVRAFVEELLGFKPTPEDELPPHLTAWADLGLGGDSTSIVLVRHTESGRVRIEEVASYIASRMTTPDHD